MSSVAIREWISARLSVAITAVAPTANHCEPPAPRTSQYSAISAIIPNRTLPIRQPHGLSPNSLIAPAMTSLASCGCSALGSLCSGASA